MINKNKILELFESGIDNSKDNKLLLSKIIDQHNRCYKSYQPSFSDFMPISTFMQFISFLEAKNEYFSLEYIIFGGFDDAERVIVGFFPEHMQPDVNLFPIEILEISYNAKYSKSLTHRDFLGSAIGLGIDRSKIGDIVNNNNNWFLFLDRDISNYVSYNMEKVGSTKVNRVIHEFKNIDNLNFNLKLEEAKVITASLRIDAVLSSSFNLSRSKITNYIKSKKVFLNFVECDSLSKIIKRDDIITIRGIGRIKIGDIVGNTKKERVVLQVFKYK
ncbi:MAG: YlmH/Sll1252 family protein [bacterium]